MKLGVLIFMMLALSIGETSKLFAYEEQQKLPTLKEAIGSKVDLYGNLAISQKNGPSYEFFENILPPPRYVNADFRYYPIVLSAPQARVKARLISNGSGINLRGGSRSWRESRNTVSQEWTPALQRYHRKPHPKPRTP